MKLLLRLAIWLIEHISPSETRQSLCGDLLEQRAAGRGGAWLTREVLAALGTAVQQRFGRFGMPLLFSLCWSALYRGYAAPQPKVMFSAWSNGLRLFPLGPVTHVLLQIAPVITFLWFGLGVFMVVQREVLRALTAAKLFLALSASHAALLLMIVVWPKHIHANVTIVPLLTERNFYLGWINLPVAISLLIAILCVLPEKKDPPRRRRRAQKPLPEPFTDARFGTLPVSSAQRRTGILYVALVLPAAYTAAATAQSARPALTLTQRASIDAFVEKEMHNERIPGLAVGVYSRGTILLAKGYGLSNVELNVPVKPETIFQSGSVGKQFVATAVLMLAEEGKLSLDDSVTKYFPEAPASWQPVKLKHMLSHTSGLAEYEEPELTKAGRPFYMRLDFTEDELVKKIAALPIEAAPGDTWKYRNTNYVLLGIMMHRITGKPYAEFLAERIFRPLAMSATRPISEADIVPNRAAGYELHGTEWKNQAWVSPTFNSTADGTLYFNVLDLAKWDGALYTTRLLKQASLDRMWTIFPLNNGRPNSASYGFGWELDPQNGHRRIEHGGSWQGFTCEISRYPDDSLSVVVLTNLDSAHARPALFAHAIAGLVEPQLAVQKLTAIQDDEPGITVSLRRLLDTVMAGQPIQEQIDGPLRAAVTPEAVHGVQVQIAPYWPGGTLTLVKREAAPYLNGARVSLYRLHKGDRAIMIHCALNQEGKFIAFGIHPDSEY